LKTKACYYRIEAKIWEDQFGLLAAHNLNDLAPYLSWIILENDELCYEARLIMHLVPDSFFTKAFQCFVAGIATN
jgi:hypothetical protein